MLPSLRVSLAVALLLWCGVGWWRMEGPTLLAYPAMWLAVGGLFLVVSKLIASAAPPKAG